MDQAAAKQDEDDVAARGARFDLALKKANYAALAMRQDADAEAEPLGDDDDDLTLLDSLAKVRAPRVWQYH